MTDVVKRARPISCFLTFRSTSALRRCKSPSRNASAPHAQSAHSTWTRSLLLDSSFDTPICIFSPARERRRRETGSVHSRDASTLVRPRRRRRCDHVRFKVIFCSESRTEVVGVPRLGLRGKLQVVLQFGVSRGPSVSLGGRGRVWAENIGAETARPLSRGEKRGSRRWRRTTLSDAVDAKISLTRWLMSTPTVAFRSHLPPVHQQLGVVVEPLHELPDASLLPR